MFLSEVAKFVALVINLNLHFMFVLLGYLALQYQIKFSPFPLDCYQVCFSKQQMGFSRQSTVFMDVEILMLTTLKISKNKPESKVDFSSIIDLVEDFIMLLIVDFAV